MKTGTVVAALAIVTGCGKRADDRRTPIETPEARARAAFPKGSPVGMPVDLHGLVAEDDGSIALVGLSPPQALAVLVDAWGPPAMDLASPDGRPAKGWASTTGTCALLDASRIVFLDCDPPSGPADDPQQYAADEARVREVFRAGAAFATPADTHGLRVRGDGAIVLPAMPMRQLFHALKDAFGESAMESLMEGDHHVTIWKHEGTCAVLDQCHDPAVTPHRCWALLWFVPCVDPDALTRDARFGHGP